MSFREVKLSGKAKGALLEGHPWIFSGAVLQTDAEHGKLVKVYDEPGEFVGFYSHHANSDIRLRLLMSAREADRMGFIEKDQEDFFRDFVNLRFKQAKELRDHLFDSRTTGYRLINGEGDLLPGVVIDRYGDSAVMQLGTAFSEKIRSELIDAIRREMQLKTLWERSAGSGRRREGQEERECLVFGEQGKTKVDFLENGVKFQADIKDGQKTGFFLDQRDSRNLVKDQARGARVLNLFSYTGAFSIFALKGGAQHVVNVESSAPANLMARELARFHGVNDKLDIVEDDVKHFFDKGFKDGFDFVVCDPPAFVKKRGDLKGALRGYTNLNIDAMRAVKPGGQLMTFSCSQHITREQFFSTVFRAASISNRQVKVLKFLTQPCDHATLPSHVEARYLKGVWCQVL